MRVRFLLLQARQVGDRVRSEERASFARALGVELDDVDTWDLTEGPPTWSSVRRHDALLVGGSGDFYVSKGDLPEHEAVLSFFSEIVEQRHPAFCSCFGFQLLVAALGGEVVHDPEAMEVGTYELTLTAHGAEDELLGTLPTRFMAQMGRKDRAARLPVGYENLAASERCRHQAFRVPGAPVWATQFHPELERSDNLKRFERYVEGYAQFLDREEQERALARFKESPETGALLRRFVELVFGERPRSAV